VLGNVPPGDWESGFAVFFWKKSTYVGIPLEEPEYQSGFQQYDDRKGDNKLGNSQANLGSSPDLRQHADILADVPTYQWISAGIQRLHSTAPTCFVSTGDEEIDYPARDQEHRENDEEDDVDHKNGVHFPNVGIPPED